MPTPIVLPHYVLTLVRGCAPQTAEKNAGLAGVELAGVAAKPTTATGLPPRPITVVIDIETEKDATALMEKLCKPLYVCWSKGV